MDREGEGVGRPRKAGRGVMWIQGAECLFELIKAGSRLQTKVERHVMKGGQMECKVVGVGEFRGCSKSEAASAGTFMRRAAMWARRGGV